MVRFFSDRHTTFFFSTFIGSALAIFGRTCHCSLTLALHSSVHKNQTFHTWFNLYGECVRVRVCVWRTRVSEFASGNHVFAATGFIILVPKMNWKKNKNSREEERSKENARTEKTEFVFFFVRGTKVADVDFYPQWNIQCVLHFGMTYWWYSRCRRCRLHRRRHRHRWCCYYYYCRQCCLFRLYIVVVVVATCVCENVMWWSALPSSAWLAHASPKDDGILNLC